MRAREAEESADRRGDSEDAAGAVFDSEGRDSVGRRGPCGGEDALLLCDAAAFQRGDHRQACGFGMRGREAAGRVGGAAHVPAAGRDAGGRASGRVRVQS